MTNAGEGGPDREKVSPDIPDNAREGVPVMLSPRLLASIVLTILALLVVVVLVGLARDNLDPTGVATVLSTLFSGIVVGALVKGTGGGKGTG